MKGGNTRICNTRMDPLERNTRKHKEGEEDYKGNFIRWRKKTLINETRSKSTRLSLEARARVKKVIKFKKSTFR